jgi:hypothetical protein
MKPPIFFFESINGNSWRNPRGTKGTGAETIEAAGFGVGRSCHAIAKGH